MRYFIFNTGGDWDSTQLFLNGDEFPATRLFIGLRTGRDDYGQPRKGGLNNGGDMEALVVPMDQGSYEQAIFPGRIDLEFPRHKVTIVNDSPMFAIELTRITLDGQDVSDEILEMEINIDAAANQASAYLSLFKPHLFAADEVATYNLL